MSKKERWTIIPSYPGFEASDLGRVRSANEVVISPHFLSRKHRYARIKIAGNPKLVHRLVIEAFVGPCPKGYEVNHKDGDKSNGALSNLEYVTHSENVKHAYDSGLNEAVRSGSSKSLRRRHADGKMPRLRGEDHHNAKLTEIEVSAIRRSHGSSASIARCFGVTRETIRDIRTRKIWRHV